MLSTADTITSRQARIRTRGMGMEMDRDAASELVRMDGAIQHAMIEIQRGLVFMLIGKGVISPEDAAVSMTRVIDRLDHHADGFEVSRDPCPSPEMLRMIAESLRQDVRDYLQQGRG